MALIARSMLEIGVSLSEILSGTFLSCSSYVRASANSLPTPMPNVGLQLSFFNIAEEFIVAFQPKIGSAEILSLIAGGSEQYTFLENVKIPDGIPITRENFEIENPNLRVIMAEDLSLPVFGSSITEFLQIGLSFDTALTAGTIDLRRTMLNRGAIVAPFLSGNTLIGGEGNTGLGTIRFPSHEALREHVLDGSTVVFIEGLPTFDWDSTSTQDDNGWTIVKPNELAIEDPGRWVIIRPSTLEFDSSWDENWVDDYVIDPISHTNNTGTDMSGIIQKHINILSDLISQDPDWVENTDIAFQAGVNTISSISDEFATFSIGDTINIFGSDLNNFTAKLTAASISSLTIDPTFPGRNIVTEVAGAFIRITKQTADFITGHRHFTKLVIPDRVLVENTVFVKSGVEITTGDVIYSHVESVTGSNNTYAPAFHFLAGSHIAKFTLWARGNSGILLGTKRVLNDMNIGSIRLFNVGQVFVNEESQHIGIRFQGFNFEYGHIQVDGGIIGVDYNSVSDIRGIAALSVTASTACRLTSGSEQIDLGIFICDSPNFLGVQIDSSDNLKATFRIFFNESSFPTGDAMESGYAVKLGIFSAADPIANCDLTFQIANTHFRNGNLLQSGGKSVGVLFGAVEDSSIKIIIANESLQTFQSLHTEYAAEWDPTFLNSAPNLQISNEIIITGSGAIFGGTTTTEPAENPHSGTNDLDDFWWIHNNSVSRPESVGYLREVEGVTVRQGTLVGGGGGGSVIGIDPVFFFQDNDSDSTVEINVGAGVGDEITGKIRWADLNDIEVGSLGFISDTDTDFSIINSLGNIVLEGANLIAKTTSWSEGTFPSFKTLDTSPGINNTTVFATGVIKYTYGSDVGNVTTYAQIGYNSGVDAVFQIDNFDGDIVINAQGSTLRVSSSGMIIADVSPSFLFKNTVGNGYRWKSTAAVFELDEVTNAGAVVSTAIKIVSGSKKLELQITNLVWDGNNIWDAGNLAVISQAESEAGTNETFRAWSALRVKQAIAALASVSDQNLFVTFSSASGARTAGSPTETFTFSGSGFISTSITASELTIAGAITDSTSTTSSVIAASATAVKAAFDNGGGSTQNLFQTFSSASGARTADSPTETFTFSGAGFISTSITASELTIAGAITDSTSTTSSVIAASATAVKAAFNNGSPDQNLFDTVSSNSGFFTANSATTTLAIVGNGPISTSMSGSTLVVSGAITDSISTTNSIISASATAVKTAFDNGSYTAGADITITAENVISVTSASALKLKNIIKIDLKMSQMVYNIGAYGSPVYTFKSDKDKGIKRGFIADYIEDCGLSGVVGYDKQGEVATLDYKGMISPLYVAFKEEVDARKSLEKRLKVLELRIEKINI